MLSSKIEPTEPSSLFMKRTGLLCLFAVLSVTIHAQLINIESQRMQTDSIRFGLIGDMTFNYSDTDGEYIFQFNTNVTTQVKTKDYKNIFFLVANYNLIRSKDQDFQNSWLLHFRYNYKLSEVLRLEAFAQTQDNELLSINSRNLLGAGLRFKLGRDKSVFKAYFGNSYMYAKEESYLVNEINYSHRNNSYLSMNINIKFPKTKNAPETNLHLTNTVYFQPLYTDISDFRVFEQFKAGMPIFGNLNITALYTYYFNNLTPAGGTEYSSLISLGFSYEFEPKPKKIYGPKI